MKVADYNTIGSNYSKTRKADDRIFQKIYELLDYPYQKMILDVGAGTGNYANLLADKPNNVVALEPSIEMTNQATAHANVKWTNDRAEKINYENNFFDCAICILSIHHFSDLNQAFDEISRILKTNGILLIYTYFPEEQEFFWLQDYFPFLFSADKDKFPGINKLNEISGKLRLKEMQVIKHELYHTSPDNFMAANWRQPEKYLIKEIRDGISTFRMLSESKVESGLRRLQDDLQSGKWHDKYNAIMNRDYFDAGYRFIKFIKK
jgi:ubiquinone/menaquinone biosynthesis C-methylase UbiE